MPAYASPYQYRYPTAFRLARSAASGLGYGAGYAAWKLGRSAFSRKAPVRKARRFMRAPLRSIRPFAGRKRRTKYARRGRPVRSKQLNKKVNTLAKRVDSTLGKLTYRVCNVSRLLASNNVQNFTIFAINSLAQTEAAIAQCRYFDAENPGGLLTASGATGTYQRTYDITSVSSTLSFRNNYLSNCCLVVYCCKIKEDTSLNANTCYTNGLTDNASDTAGTSILSYPTDSIQFNNLWKIKKKYTFNLRPGSEASVSVGIKGYRYDPSLSDSHVQDNQTAHNCHQWFVFLSGVLSHDSAADEQGYEEAGVDIAHYKTIKVKYPAGANIHYIYTAHDFDTPTNGFVQSFDSVPDNLGYSAS